MKCTFQKCTFWNVHFGKIVNRTKKPDSGIQDMKIGNFYREDRKRLYEHFKTIVFLNY